MDISGRKILIVGGAGFIGSHIVDELLKEDVAEICIYDNFCRGTYDNIALALKEPRVKIFELGGDILQIDILNEAVKGKKGLRLSSGSAVAASLPRLPQKRLSHQHRGNV